MYGIRYASHHPVPESLRWPGQGEWPWDDVTGGARGTLSWGEGFRPTRRAGQAVRAGEGIGVGQRGKPSVPAGE